MIKAFTFSLIISFIMFASEALPETYYVDGIIGSNSNSGLEFHPWKTIQQAADSLKAGDTVLIKPGAYEERVVAGQSGEPGKPIVFMNQVAGQLTLDGRNVDRDSAWSGLFDFNGQGFIMIQGFDIINSKAAGFYGKGSNNIYIYNCSIMNTDGSGIEFSESEFIYIEENRITNSCLSQEGAAISISNVNNFRVFKNDLFHFLDSGKDGICAISGSHYGEIYENFIRAMKGSGIYIDAGELQTGNIEIYNNFIHECGDGMAAASRGGLLENIKFYNNIVFDNETNGFILKGMGSGEDSSPMKEIIITNNNFLNNCNNGFGGGIYIENPDLENVSIQNNIVSANQSYQIYNEALLSSDKILITNNLIDGFRGLERETMGEKHVEGDPQFVNVSEANFYIEDGSPAIDKGLIVNSPQFDFNYAARPYGSGVDIGAVENFTKVAVEETPEFNNESKAFPNPFTDNINIIFYSSSVLSANVKIFSPEGRLIRLLPLKTISPGEKTVAWDGKDERGTPAPNGVYYYSIETINGSSDFQPIVILR